MAALITGVDFDPAKISFMASTTGFWKELGDRGVKFAYGRFLNGLTPPSFWETRKLLGVATGRPNANTKEGILLGAYCILDPLISGKTQATEFINYMLAVRHVDPIASKTYSFASWYRLRPALWLVKVHPVDPKRGIDRALEWLETVDEFLAKKGTNAEGLYDHPIIACSSQYAANYDVTPLSNYKMWVFDRANDAKQNRPANVPVGLDVDLWQKYPEIDIQGEPFGWDLSVNLGKSREQSTSVIPWATMGVIAGLAGLAYLLTTNKSKTSSASSFHHIPLVRR